MNIGDYIKVVLSFGKIEEGIIHSFNNTDDGENWIVLSHVVNSNIRLNVNRKYIAAYQINIKQNEDDVLMVDDLSLNELVVDHKERITKLAEMRINQSFLTKQNIKKLFENKNQLKTNSIKYNIPKIIK